MNKKAYVELERLKEEKTSLDDEQVTKPAESLSSDPGLDLKAENPAGDEDLISSFVSSGSMTYMRCLKLMIFSTGSSFWILLAAPIVTALLSLLVYFTDKGVSASFYACVGLTGFIVLIFLFCYLVTPLTLKYKDKKGLIKSDVSIYKDKLVVRNEVTNNSIKSQSTMTLIYKTCTNAKEGKDGFFFKNGEKPFVVFYIGKDSGLTQSDDEFLSSFVKQVKQRNLK